MSRHQSGMSSLKSSIMIFVFTRGDSDVSSSGMKSKIIIHPSHHLLLLFFLQLGICLVLREDKSQFDSHKAEPCV